MWVSSSMKGVRWTHVLRLLAVLGVLASLIDLALVRSALGRTDTGYITVRYRAVGAYFMIFSPASEADATLLVRRLFGRQRRERDWHPVIPETPDWFSVFVPFSR